MSTEQFDVIIIGAGQAGGPLSTALAQAGRRTALIEREHVGGTCINEGCTPTKTMVASARVAHLARRAADYGVHTGPVTVNLGEVRARKRAIVEDWRGGSQRSIEATPGVELLLGAARFSGPKEVAVQLADGRARTLTAPTIVINAGARPTAPTIAGSDAVPWLTSTTVMELDAVPEHLVIVGGGYIGLEFGQMFRRFGSAVTIIQRAARLLDREDDDIADAVADIMRDDGITLHLRSQPVSVAATTAGIDLTIATAEGQRTVSGSHLLFAAGRRSNADSLNVAASGIALDSRGFIPVDERLQTNVSGIYAVGDITGGPAFTHISYDDFRILRTNLLGAGDATTSGRLVPYTVFIDPQLGRVGLSEREAAAQGRAVRVAKLPMSHVARAIETDETRGFMKALVDPADGQILGCAILGIEGGEVMSALQIAMLGKLPYTALQGWRLRPPDAGRVAQQPIYGAGRGLAPAPGERRKGAE